MGVQLFLLHGLQMVGKALEVAQSETLQERESPTKASSLWKNTADSNGWSQLTYHTLYISREPVRYIS